MKFSTLSKLTLAPFAGALLLLHPASVQAGGEGFSKDTLSDSSKESFDSKSSDLGLGKFSSNPFHVSVTVRGGYDDNVNLSSIDRRESFFTNAALGVTYDFGSPRTRLNLNAGVSGTYYWDDDDVFSDDEFGDDDDSDDFALNAYLGFSITHRATPRLTLAASVSLAYLDRPGFDTFNSSFLNVERRSQNYFQTLDKFTVTYAWAPRFSTATSYTFGYVDFDDNLTSRYEDRFEHTFGNEFRFLLLPTTTLVGEYRLGIIDYLHQDFRNSMSHFFLAGVDHSFSPRFNISARAGVEVRDFDIDDDPEANAIFGDDEDGTSVAPYAEATLTYAIAQSTSLSWTNRFALEQPHVPDALERQTFRTALSLRHNFTARISAALNAAYQHDDYDETFSLAGFEEDAFDVALSARYAINRNFAFDVGYQHTEVISDEDLFREFSRNQVYAGITFTW